MKRAYFYVVSTAGLIESLLVGELDKTPEEIVGFLDQVIHDHTRGAKLRFEGQDNDWASPGQ